MILPVGETLKLLAVNSARKNENFFIQGSACRFLIYLNIPDGIALDNHNTAKLYRARCYFLARYCGVRRRCRAVFRSWRSRLETARCSSPLSKITHGRLTSCCHDCRLPAPTLPRCRFSGAWAAQKIYRQRDLITFICCYLISNSSCEITFTMHRVMIFFLIYIYIYQCSNKK